MKPGAMPGSTPSSGRCWRLHSGCGRLLEQINSQEDLTWARYHDVVMPEYHTDRCVVVGDAAHATSPQLGQGTNLALLDAVVLCECLGQDVPLAQALERYTQMRRRHLHFYSQASRWLTPLFQSDLWVLPFLRDLFMNSGFGLPVMGPLTRQTLVGVRQAWLSGETLATGEPAGAGTPPEHQPTLYAADPGACRDAAACRESPWRPPPSRAPARPAKPAP